MDNIISHQNQERLSTTYINNTFDPNNETTNPEGDLNFIDNNYLFEQKEIDYLNLIDKQTKANTNEHKDDKNLFNYDNDILNVDDEINKKLNENLGVKDLSKKNQPKKESSEKPKKKCGRKRKDDDKEPTEYDKFSDTNIRRKCKHLVLKSVMILINQKIYNIYGGKIGNGICRKQLKVLNHNQKKNASVKFNQNFLYKKLGEIFSENVSGRYTNFPLIHNKRLISTLINEKDEIKKNYFVNLFNITFLECLKHFRGEIFLKELEGLTCFENLKEDIKSKCKEEGDDYVEALDYYFNNFEIIVNNKRPRLKNIDK